MKFDITQQSAFTTLVTIFVMGVIGFFALVNQPTLSADFSISDSLLGGYITDFQNSHTTLSAFFAAIIIFISTTRLGRIVSGLKVYGSATSIHIFVISSVAWCTIQGGNFLLATLLTALLACAIGSMLKAVRSTGLENIFNASLALSLLPTLYLPSIILWLPMPFIILFIGATFRELIVAIVGLLLPAAITLYIFWLCGASFVGTIEECVVMFMQGSSLVEIDVIQVFRVSLLVVAMLLALISTFWVGDNIPRTRARLVIIIILLIATLATFIIPSANLASLSLVAPPLALLAAFGMAHMRGLISNIIYILFWLLLLASLFTPYYYAPSFLPIGTL